MRNTLLRGLFLIFSLQTGQQMATAQKSMINYLDPEGFSLGMSVGLSDLWSDVGTQNIVDHYLNSHYWNNPKFIGGLTVGYALHPSLVARVNINHGTLYASDMFNKEKAEKAANAEDDAYQRYVRNQDVKSILWEGNFMLEFAPLRMNIDSRSALKRMQPYLLAGIGGFHFNPKGRHISREGYEKGWTELYDLNLEGNGWNFDGSPEQYNRWQLQVPLGLGIKWDLTRRFGVGVEYIYRYCFTDYLDNVSGNYVPKEYFEAKFDPQQAQLAGEMSDKSWKILGDKNYYHSVTEKRGNKDVNDAYSSLNFRIFWKIKSKKQPWWY